MTNKTLRKQQETKNDEYYTQYTDIEKEIGFYNLSGKRIYCPCDDYRISNFVKYFKNNFSTLKIKHLTATNYDNGTGAYRYDFDGVEERITPLKGNGDFRSNECTEIQKENDIVITNPPYSQFRDFFAWLSKDYLIISNINVLSYKGIFPQIMENKIKVGLSHPFRFILPNGDTKKILSSCWITNLTSNTKIPPIKLREKYNPEKHQRFDNYDAINVNRVTEIPIDYKGVIGVPISFLSKYNSGQFEIVGILNHKTDHSWDFGRPIINGKERFKRILIRWKEDVEENVKAELLGFIFNECSE